MFYIWSMQKDFAKLIRDYQARHNPLIVLAFHLVLMRDSELRLTLDLAAKETIHNPQSTTIQCINAVDYSLNPPTPEILPGGPEIQYFDAHPLLEDKRLQRHSGGNGEVFHPPMKFGLLIVDQSYVIAESFLLEESPLPAGLR
jgi:hypothetical protein